MDKKEKIIIIPGWMDRAHFHCKWKDLNVWASNIKPDIKIKAEYVVGHSAGALFALYNWNYNKKNKIILINPLLLKKHLFSWLIRFIRFSGNEPLLNPIKRIPMFLRIFPWGVLRLIKVNRIDPIKIIKKIPKNKLIIIYGKEDNYFFDNEAREIIKNMDIKMVEIKEAAHNWNSKFNEAIEDIINRKL